MGAKTHFPARLENANYDFLWREAKHRGLSMNALLNEIIRLDKYAQERMTKRSVYVIHDGLGNYKIGIAVNTQSRRNNIQSGNSEPVSIVYARQVGKSAGQIERRLHERFMSKKVRGEWFRLSQDDLNEIDKVVSGLISPSSQNAVQR